ncbi:hypothetical protein KFL_000890310 [Klebsormidium nitens]|uniref:Uncharacterized protein n=1 Tax=Klebsormidium nitens TaxID=105231 RepID=A0A1Y1HVB2_KLENI|nr:hypothetical protein KFL_000890310 [Klebsormidium nitens]|eukprot:GAQ81742.1 hypothetical protein KFL_000890310 [Klebsormidium nitens]
MAPNTFGVWRTSCLHIAAVALALLLGPFPRLASIDVPGPCCDVFQGANRTLVDFPWPEACSCLSESIALDLSNRSIGGSLPQSWAYPDAFPDLQLLDLSNNQLSSPLPGAWGNALGAFRALQVLNLSSNSLSSVPEEWGSSDVGFPKLQSLLLSYNVIETLPESWATSGTFPELLELDFLGNRIVVLPKAWGQTGSFPKLQLLGLELNLIEEVPSSWSNPNAFPTLQVLGLFGNQLSTLPDAWAAPLAFPSLAFLTVGGKISKVPPSWSQPGAFPNLRYLDLTLNPLQEPPRLWGACFDDVGCGLNIGGTRAARRLSRAYKKQVCLGKVAMVVGNNWQHTLTFLNTTHFRLDQNPYIYSLVDPNLLEKLLPTMGTSYTGARFKPPRGDKCRDDQAPIVIAVAWAIWFGILLLIILAVHFFYPGYEDLLATRSSRNVSQPSPTLRPVLVYVSGGAGPVFTLVGLVLNLVLLVAIAGTWPMYVLLGVMLLNYVITGLVLAVALAHVGVCKQAKQVKTKLLGGVNFHLNWQLAGTSFADVPARDTEREPALTLLQWVKVPPLLVLGVILTLLLDLLTAASQLGGQLIVSGNPINLKDYYTGRQFVQAIFGTLLQAVFGSLVYSQGTSRITPIYVDRVEFLAVIFVQLVSLLYQAGALCCELKSHPNASLCDLLRWKIYCMRAPFVSSPKGAGSKDETVTLEQQEESVSKPQGSDFIPDQGASKNRDVELALK